MSKDYDAKPEEGDEEDQLDDISYATQKEATLFVIHVSQSMVSSTGVSKTGAALPSALQNALQCCYDFLTVKIISSPNDMVGVMLYGTEDAKASDGMSDTPNIYQLIDLDQPEAFHVLHLKDVLTKRVVFDAVCKPSTTPVSMPNVLFRANEIFSSKASNFNLKRLLLITDDDNPHDGNDGLRRSTITRARDLNDLGIKIEPIFVSSPDKPFSSRKFYDDIIYREEDDIDENNDLVEESNLRLRQMREKIKAKATPKRSQFNLMLELGPGLSVGVKGYILYKKQEIAKSTYIYNLGEKPQIARIETTNQCEETSATLKKEDIRKACKFGEDLIPFTEGELADIRQIEQPVIRILGFKSIDKLRFWDNIRPSYFIYPSEANVVGSTRTFAALHKKLVKSNRMGIAWFIARKNSNPTFVALVASDERFDKATKLQTTPPGIFLITLPYLDDIRFDPAVVSTVAPVELINSMASIIDNTTLSAYDPCKYMDPSLQWHWRVLQAQALKEEEDAIVPRDTTKPSYKRMAERLNSNNLAGKWKSLLEKANQSQPPAEKSAEVVKRKGSDSHETNGKEESKRTRLENTTRLTLQDLQVALEAGKLDRLTLPHLKQAISSNPTVFTGKPASTKKADILDYVTEMLNKL